MVAVAVGSAGCDFVAEGARDTELEHLGGTLVDAQRTGGAVGPFDDGAVDESPAAHDLHAPVDDAPTVRATPSATLVQVILFRACIAISRFVFLWSFGLPAEVLTMRPPGTVIDLRNPGAAAIVFDLHHGQ